MRRFRITAERSFHSLNGIEFEVEDEDADDEEKVAKAAFDAVAEHLSYGWEEIECP